MLLEEFFDYKSELIKTLCSNKDIVRLITDCEKPKVPNHDLAYTHIFPYEYIPDIVDEGKTFICCDVDITQVMDKTYYKPTLYIWAFTYKTKLHLPDGGVRTDELARAINAELNGNRNYGLGTLELQSVSSFAPIKDYLGRQLVYGATDFNRPGISKKPPVNRKTRQ